MKSTFKKLLPFAVVGILSGATTVGVQQYLVHDSNNGDQSYFTKSNNASFVGMNTATVGDDFVKASKMTVPAVVTIKNYQNRASSRASEQDLFDFFFGDPLGGKGQQRQKQQQAPENMPSGLGSGVIISPDGYIISNNHVVAGANKLEVVLSNKKSYIATLVGTDPNTDISLLKIEEKGLPYLNFANSDNIEVGQWVLAVGNPLGLNSTVTAGIISAKGRGIGILSGQGKATNPIESFIQTDAAINPGNSGGALVNVNGDLIGINSAISSTNGYYQGYGFAVPANLARKIIEDIKKFGIVQRGFLGVNSLDLSNDQQVAFYNQEKKTNIKPGSGVYIIGLPDNSGAQDAGMKIGDIITKIDGVNITDFADLSVAIGSKRPGDKVQVTYTRNGKETTSTVTLRDQKGGTSARTKADLSVTEKIGAEFQSLDDRTKAYYGLSSGVVAKNVVEGSEIAKAGIVDGYIITEINGKPVNSQKDVENLLNKFTGTGQIKYMDDYGRGYQRGFKMP
ncbi:MULTISPECIES: trypsin-like peptidase domain-containing protein [Chryseobacterium]|uniref:Do/DeqQ family serine protease n=1 Tax=Chryseobacterium indoltheticum TaxID=254 RepID=A0A381F7F4_9FLAO|nr:MULTISPECIES: trypsin-like peptidase domain-containing protein [Chryseobacterium]AZA61492.1 PDZ domain-containing protein [Chryseobacterium indoltheticum]AZA72849.1 PDZ domain-containing protein [Chryseobacterium indoltheticum]MDQ8142171.1 trypsin-like peptidase domain-containing protein [Chryseobacterium sp. CFS15]SIP87912.1 Do/DeqQ family serine protease [Chryseobacterium indoltheticum]SUX42455.1 Probable periplasmic serine endoprotease DegP-like precursor [Chryseobacterium indoltheticum]